MWESFPFGGCWIIRVRLALSFLISALFWSFSRVAAACVVLIRVSQICTRLQRCHLHLYLMCFAPYKSRILLHAFKSALVVVLHSFTYPPTAGSQGHQRRQQEEPRSLQALGDPLIWHSGRTLRGERRGRLCARHPPQRGHFVHLEQRQRGQPQRPLPNR
jgi:hypothetical protein